MKTISKLWSSSTRTSHKSSSYLNKFIACFLTIFMLSLSACKPDADEAISTKNSTSTSNARVAATAVNGVMMQGFYWDVPVTTPGIGTWWQNLGAKALELKNAGITAMWIPPAYKGSGAGDVGYGVYDRYDLGEFNQKGTIATRYGTLAQLQAAITSLHNNNIQVYEDMVMNHLVFADATETINTFQGSKTIYTKFDYVGRNNTYSAYKWNASLMTGAQQAPNNGWYQWNNWDFNPYNNGDAYDNLLGCEIKYNPETGSGALETISWGNWITTKLGLDGYRLDATKHIYTPFVNKWLDNVKGTKFAVSEAWMNDVNQLNAYVTATGGRTSLFDVPLHYMFTAMSGGNGTYNMANFAFAGFTEANGPLSVSFVDNHDTDQTGGALFSPVINLKMLAYAYILTREKGYPCVFYRDYYEYGLGNQIKKLIECRQANGFGAGFEYTSANDADCYVYSRAGDATHAGMLVMLNDGSTTKTKTVTTPFINATLTDKTGNTAGTVTTNASGVGTFSVNSRNYAVWVPGVAANTAPVLSISPAAGAVTSGTVVTLTGTDNSGIAPTIYYTTNGTTPTTASTSATGSKAFTITAGTTIKAFAVDNLGLASAVATYVYTIGTSTTTGVTFNVNYSGTTVGQEVYVVGSTAQLGAWNTANAIKLSGTGFPTWTKLVNLTTGTAVQYKYIRKDANGANVLYEGGSNRTFTPTGASQTRNDTWQP
jgi:alpha-amylase